MRGILIYDPSAGVGAGIHTGDDLDLVQTEKEIENPTVQSYRVQVPGRNGLLNLTKSLTGRVCYNNRKLSFVYIGTGTREDLQGLKDEFDQYHGETLRIVDDDHPRYYYDGEFSIESKIIGNYIRIEIEVDALPFRYALLDTVNIGSVTATGTNVIINNPGVAVVPTVKVTAQTVMTIGGKTYNLSAGTYSDLDIILETGDNTINFKGSGKYTVTFQEAMI